MRQEKAVSGLHTQQSRQRPSVVVGIAELPAHLTRRHFFRD
jgi:hypothetical protein